MYVYQDGKLYVLTNDKLVGVEIYSDKVVLVEGTETVLGKKFEILTSHEVNCRFGIYDGAEYIFPKEVIGSEPTTTTKRTSRKSTSK